MKLSAVTLEPRATGARLSTRVSWEDSERPPNDVWIDISGVEPGAVSNRPEAFLPACAIVAMKDGERRISVEGPVCPRLRDGLAVATTILREWHGPPRRGAVIEASGGFVAPVPAPQAREALLFTGGVSSLHSLVAQPADDSLDHPMSVRDLLWVEGLSSPRTASRRFGSALGRSQPRRLPPVVGSTNFRCSHRNSSSITASYLARMLSGVGHALRDRLTALHFLRRGTSLSAFESPRIPFWIRASRARP